jgi:cbb3-type cytochrome oxidase subunit 3
MAKKSLKNIVLLYGIFIVSIVIYWGVYILLPEFHSSYFQGEDRLVEWLTFIFFFAASILSFLTLLYRSTMKKLAIWYFLLMGIFLLVCAGEEISWGQRIIGFQTPEKISIINEQKEFNVHNLQMKYIHPYGIFSFIMFFYGIILPIVFSKQLKKKTSQARRYISPLVLVPCFLFPLILGSTKSLIIQYPISDIASGYGTLTNELREMYWGLSMLLASIALFNNNRRINNHLT